MPLGRRVRPRRGARPLPAPSPYTINLVDNVKRLKLDVQRVAHVHGGVDSFDTVLKAAGRSTTEERNFPVGQDLTQLLVQWKGGDEDALARLLPLVYKDLRSLARTYPRRERRGHTLQTVHISSAWPPAP